MSETFIRDSFEDLFKKSSYIVSFYFASAIVLGCLAILLDSKGFSAAFILAAILVLIVPFHLLFYVFGLTLQNAFYRLIRWLVRTFLQLDYRDYHRVSIYSMDDEELRIRREELATLARMVREGDLKVEQFDRYLAGVRSRQESETERKAFATSAVLETLVTIVLWLGCILTFLFSFSTAALFLKDGHRGHFSLFVVVLFLNLAVLLAAPVVIRQLVASKRMSRYRQLADKYAFSAWSDVSVNEKADLAHRPDLQEHR